MKNLIAIAVIAILLSSCRRNTYPLKGVTYEEISTIRSGKPAKEVWGSMIHIFENHGYTIKESDKDKGIIVTGLYDFDKRCCFVKNGKPMDSLAWIALSYIRLRGGFGDNPIKVSAAWKVAIRPNGSGSIVKIALTDVDATVHIPEKRTFHPDADYTFTGISTGVFEKIMAAEIR